MADFFVILGRQPEISLAELNARASIDTTVLEPLMPDAAFVGNMRDPVSWFGRFGGLQKIAEVVERLPASAFSQEQLVALVRRSVSENRRFTFGFSAYGSSIFRRKVEQWARIVKKTLVAEDRSVRYVKGERCVLSSVVAQKQLLDKNGAEFLFVVAGGELIIGKTAAGQAFEEFSKRDYGRPGRNARSGMLPPKLARIMVNLARQPLDAMLLDSFCGSGTVLQEAILLGYYRLTGADVNTRAIQESEENLAWLARSTGKKALSRLMHSDIAVLEHSLRSASIDAIITEPYLGPPATGKEPHSVLEQRKEELGALYEKAFRVFANVLKPNGSVVIVFPVLFLRNKPLFFIDLDPILLNGFRLIQPFPPELVPIVQDRLTYRHSLLYHRPGQHVGREILLFRNQG